MARSDMDIKGDVISELEDFKDPASGATLLDALMVEDVAVQIGQVLLTLVYHDERPAADRAALQADVEATLMDIEGVAGVAFFSVDRAALPYRTLRDAVSAAPAPVAASAPPAPAADKVAATAAPPSEGPRALTLSQLIAGAAEDDSPAPVESPTSIGIYSGGGCGAGTLVQPTSAPKAAPVTAAPAKAPAPAPRAAAPSTTETAGPMVADQEAWSALLLERQALELRNIALEQRVAALQNALRALIDE